MSQFKFITKHFGYDHQFIGTNSKLAEEMGELLEAIASGNHEHILDELADVECLLIQLKIHYGIDNVKVATRITEKVKRTHDRIESGYYEVNK